MVNERTSGVVMDAVIEHCRTIYTFSGPGAWTSNRENVDLRLVFLTTAPSIRTILLMFYTHQFDAQNKLVGPYQGPTADKFVLNEAEIATADTGVCTAFGIGLRTRGSTHF